jgi:uncharacterized LabA/DUF88 family protein
MPKGKEPFNAEKPWENLLWCDLEALIKSYHFLNANLIQIKFFEAPSYKPDSLIRQQVYINALKSLATMKGDCFFGGDYKLRGSTCPGCGKSTPYYTEKGTDVQLGIELVSDFLQGRCSSAIVISGDNDLLPAYKKIKVINPKFLIYLIFPPHRSSDDVKRVVGPEHTRKIKYERLSLYQLPDELEIDGFKVEKPFEYRNNI